MRTLNFAVDGQCLSTDGDFSNIVKGTKGYLVCQFSFNSSDWSGCKAAAVFERRKEEYAIAINPDGTCIVPDEVTDASAIKLRVVGIRGTDYRISTNKVLIDQEG